MQKDKKVVSHTTPSKKPDKSTDWAKIKKEYLDGASMRSLATKHGLAVSTISARASKEKWKETAQKIANKTEQKYVERKASQKAQIKEAYSEAVVVLIRKALEGLSECDISDSKSLKEYSSILKDLKDIGIYRTNLDLKEQRAKINKLTKDEKSEDKSITITLAGGDDYAN